MSIFSDFVDSISDWFEEAVHDLLKDGIVSNFANISDTLQSTYSGATEDDGLVSQFITVHPYNFTGGGTSADTTTVWSTIEGLCNNVVVPIAGFILIIVLINDLIQMVIGGNNFRDFDDSIFVKWIIKAFCGILLVSNTFYIASGLFSFGTSVCANGISYLFGDSGLSEISLSEFENALNAYDNGTMLMMLLLSFLIMILVFLLTVVIVIVMASRIIEIFMYLGVSPIPMATLMNNEWGQIGKNWIKSVLALSFQGFFLIIALGLFQTIFNNVITDITAAENGIVMPLLMLSGYTGALIFTILRTGQISRSVFNAS